MANTIITISRQFGSGGREIGELIGEKLGIKVYDKELLTIASKESGICEELFETHDEKPTNSFLYSLVMDSYSMNYNSNAFADMPINHKVFLAQFDTIKKIADKGPCVIVGRCADYALADYSNCVHIFIYAALDSRVSRIARINEISEAKSRDMILKTDKQRASYYNYYTTKKWGDISSYDLCINSTQLGIEATAQFILDYVDDREKLLKDNTKGLY